ncbi:hypothetical protein [Microcoleus sp. CAWBG51]|uniref:hypothetical protein n=1 Tax=Microcoleus sp. CAWBG51 TaxID=2841648 RepID=UPI0025F220BF|nr:hypothetical protein [Microcoleus sp. CAWBG51]
MDLAPNQRYNLYSLPDFALSCQTDTVTVAPKNSLSPPPINVLDRNIRVHTPSTSIAKKNCRSIRQQVQYQISGSAIAIFGPALPQHRAQKTAGRSDSKPNVKLVAARSQYPSSYPLSIDRQKLPIDPTASRTLN